MWILAPPSLSIDLLSYISHGYIGSVQDANPYVVPSSAVAATAIGPELASYGWKPAHPVSPYGPVWTHLEVGVVALSQGVRAQMVVLKLIVVVFSLGSAALLKSDAASACIPTTVKGTPKILICLPIGSSPGK